MSEHALNELNRQAVRAAEIAYSINGDMADAIRAAARSAMQDVAALYRNRRGLEPGERQEFENRDVINVLYCAGRLERVTA